MNAHTCMNESLLVVGCGYVGSVVAQEFAQKGGQSYGLRRRPGLLPEGVIEVLADAAEPGALPGIRDLSGIVFALSAGERSPGAYRRAYVEAPLAVLRALGSRVGDRTRVVVVSSTAVYGQDEGTIDEHSETNPRAETARLLVEGELAVRAAHPGARSVRLAGIYGPSRARLVRQVLAGGPFDAPHSQIGNRIHRDDAAAHVLALLEAEDAPAILNGVDDATVPLGEVRAFVARRAGLDASPYDVPHGATGKRVASAARKALRLPLRVATYREGYPAIVDAVLRT